MILLIRNLKIMACPINLMKRLSIVGHRRLWHAFTDWTTASFYGSHICSHVLNVQSSRHSCTLTRSVGALIIVCLFTIDDIFWMARICDLQFRWPFWKKRFHLVFRMNRIILSISPSLRGLLLKKKYQKFRCFG